MQTSTSLEAEIPRTFHWYDYITFNIYFFGLTTLAQTLGLITPLLVQQFVGEAQQGTYYGTFRLYTLMVALLAQALMGMLSDRSTSRWGRRRPYILVGTVLTAVLTFLMGFTIGMVGMIGFWVLLAIGLVQPIASNASQAAEQGIIPDLVPEQARGRFSGVKAMFEVPLPLLVVAVLVGKLVSNNQLWLALMVAIAVLVAVMLLSMLVPERRLTEKPAPINWQPFVRLVIMTAAFTFIIIGAGRLVNLVSSLLVNLSSATLLFAVMGLVGLAGMVVAVALGVWLSVRISLGHTAAQNPSFTWWVVNRLAFLVGAFNLSTFAVYFLQARLGYEKVTAAGPASRLILFVGLFILISTLPAGWLSDRFGKKFMVAIAGVVAVIGTLVALIIPNLTVIYVGGSIIGIGVGFFYTANWALGTLLVPKQQAARYLGISNLAGAGAGAVGAYIGGPIADFVTAQAPQVPGLGYVLLFSIYGLMFLFSIIALTQVKAHR
jgi:MFS family permease